MSGSWESGFEAKQLGFQALIDYVYSVPCPALKTGNCFEVCICDGGGNVHVGITRTSDDEEVVQIARSCASHTEIHFPREAIEFEV